MPELPGESHLDPEQKLESCGYSSVVLTQAHKRRAVAGEVEQGR